MKKSTLLNSIGFALLAAAFAWSAQRAFTFSPKPAGAREGVTLRFAHWQLEGGLREAFDHLAREYEKLHPGVRVEQVAVPERIYTQWLNTQLVGGTITDLVALGRDSTDEILARYFTPLTEYVDQPNPYNAGTELAGLPWRETILDGLQGDVSYNRNLLEYYGVSMSMFTLRIYYNRNLWHALLGDTPPPANYDEFIAICDRVRAHRDPSGAVVIPVAGSKDNAGPIVERLFGSQTQRLIQKLDLPHDLRPNPTEVSLAYVRGEWSLDDPALGHALEINREAGLNFQPGYTQLGRDDAAFYFVQGRALMIATGSWDSTSFRKQADFDIGVFRIPIPAPGHPRYGAQLYGPAAENDTGTGLNFGIPRMTPHFEQALDFLRFLASQPANSEFSLRSGWLPSVVGVKPPPAVAPFLPATTGYVDGFSFGQFGADTKLVVNSRMNRLVAPSGSVDDFREAVRPELDGAFRSDLARTNRNATLNIARQDVIFAALTNGGAKDTATNAAKASQILEAQNRTEAQTAWINLELNRTAASR